MSNTLTQGLILSNVSKYKFIGEVFTMAGDVVPKNCMETDGSLQNITDFPKLFSIIGTTYGGDGVTTFALPDIRNRTIFSKGDDMTFGAHQGTDEVVLNESQMPKHSHDFKASKDLGDSNNPEGAFLSNTGAFDTEYKTVLTNGTTLNPGAISDTGGNDPVNLINPSIVLKMLIVVDDSCC